MCQWGGIGSTFPSNVINASGNISSCHNIKFNCKFYNLTHKTWNIFKRFENWNGTKRLT